MLRLQANKFNIQHIQSTDMISDSLASTSPLSQSDTIAEDFINMTAHNAIPISSSIEKIAAANKTDAIVQEVISSSVSGHWAKKSGSLKKILRDMTPLASQRWHSVKRKSYLNPTKL